MLGKNVSYRQIRLLLTPLGLGIIATAVALFGTSRAFGGKAGYQIGANSELSAFCGGPERRGPPADAGADDPAVAVAPDGTGCRPQAWLRI